MPRKKPASAESVLIPNTELTLPRIGDGSHVRVPKWDPDYNFRPEIFYPLVFAVDSNQPVLLTGDAGGGKSSAVEQLAHLLGAPLVRYNCHTGVDDQALVGAKEPDGETRELVWKDGLVVRAMREGWWLLLDEMDRAVPTVLFVLQNVLEENGRITLPTGEVVTKHPNFRIFATANTIGPSADHRSLYVGASGRLDEATLDRFGVVIHVEYMDAATEKKIIAAKVPEVDPDFLEQMIEVANEARQSLASDLVTSTFSTRRLLQWARASGYGFHPATAAQLAFINKLTPEDASTVRGVVERHFSKARPVTKVVRQS